MKILIISKFNPFEKNETPGWYYNKALTSMGHECTLFHPNFNWENISFRKKLNFFLKHTIGPRFRIDLYRYLRKRFIAMVKAVRPDFVLVCKGDELDGETLQEMRRIVSNAIIVNVFPDNPLFYQIPFLSIPGYDHFFVKDTYVLGELAKMGARNVHYLAECADVEILRPMTMMESEREKYGSDLSFVGSLYPYRAQILEVVRGLDLKVWGSGCWGVIPKDSYALSRWQEEPAAQEVKAKVFTASKINLNTHNPRNDVFSVNLRVFEIAAVGFQIVDKRRDLASLFEIGKEVICFETREQLRELVDYYLEHPEERQAIAKRARERVCKEHTYSHRWAEILKICGITK